MVVVSAFLLLVSQVLYIVSAEPGAPVSVQLSTGDFSAICCPVDGAEPCIEEDCPISIPSGVLTDGDALTEWIIDTTSENGARAQIFFDLGQVSFVNLLTS